MGCHRRYSLVLKFAFLLVFATSTLCMIHLTLHERAASGYYRNKVIRGERVNSASQGGYQKERFVVAYLVSGLGNHLWIYSSLYGIAKKTSRTPIACAKYNLSKLFSNLSIKIRSYKNCKYDQRLPDSNSLKIKENKFIYYDTKMVARLKEANNTFTSISVFFQNIGYFVEYIDELKHQLRLREPIRLRAQHFLYQTIQTYYRRRFNMTKKTNIHIGLNLPALIAVHVRRGDMLKHPFTIVPSQSYFSKAMTYFRNKYRNRAIFIVVTNDWKWTKRNIKGIDVFLTHDTGPKSKEEDFAIAVSCNHTVMSVGTFGWWMGFLAGGEVVYFKDWIKGSAKQWYNNSQYFPHNFQAII